MGKIISLVNNKGGVGKTTVSVNLAHALANKNLKILLVDVDSQCNATSTFFDMPSKNTLNQLYTGEAEIANCIHTTEYQKLYFLPNHHDTAALEPSLSRRDDYGWFLLRDQIRDYALENFDITLIDCPPNLGTFSLQAMIASDFVIVPVEAGSRYATDGLDRTVSTIEEIAATEGIGQSGIFLRLVINKADRRTTVSKVTIDQVSEIYKDQVFKNIIPINTDIQQSELLGKTVIRHASKSKGSQAFRKLAYELLDILK